MLTFAIGDSHGCAKTLKALFARCQEFASTRTAKARFIFLGDYCDRGPDTKGVYDFLLKMPYDYPQLEVICLKGNHDEMLELSVLEQNVHAYQVWLSNGGVQTLKSYGIFGELVDPETGRYSFPAPQVLKDNPDLMQHANWVHDLPLSAEDDYRFFCHAGIDPGIPLAEQNPDTLLWTREPFLSSKKDHGKLIVHGHTPQEGTPENKPNRVNVDTACCFGYKLTAAVFNNGQRQPMDFIQVEKID